MRFFHVATASLMTLKFTLSVSKLSVARNTPALLQTCHNFDTLRLSKAWAKAPPASSAASTATRRPFQREKNRLMRCRE